jgi:hypothetical protein
LTTIEEKDVNKLSIKYVRCWNKIGEIRCFPPNNHNTGRFKEQQFPSCHITYELGLKKRAYDVWNSLSPGE